MNLSFILQDEDGDDVADDDGDLQVDSQTWT
jgi:hypothetical protein